MNTSPPLATNDGAMPALQLTDVQAGYGDAIALDNVSLSLSEGSSLAVLGRNGMGKTTLILTLMGLTTLHTGRISLGHTSIEHLAPWQRARMGMGWVPQERAVFKNLTVDEHLQAVARPGHWTRRNLYQQFPRLRERRHHTGNQLSGGEQQMLAIARALATNPTILLLDEPLEGLAPQMAQEVLDAVKALVHDTRLMAIIVEQHPEQILPVTDHAVILERGCIVYQSASSSLLADTSAQAHWLGVQ